MRKLFVLLVVAVGLGSVAQAQSKVAHVDTQALFDTMPSKKKAQESIEILRQDMEQELAEMAKVYETKVKELEAQRSSLIPAVITKKEEDLYRRQNTIMRREQELQYDLQQLSQELNDQLMVKIQEAVKIVADRLKINYVVDKASVVYAAGGIDITDEVAAELLKLDATPQ